MNMTDRKKDRANLRLDSAMTDHERRRVRLDEDARRILEDVMLRRRWSATDKERLVECLVQIVGRELKGGREGAKSAKGEPKC